MKRGLALGNDESAKYQLAVRRSQPSETVRIREWIKEHHYFKSAPPGQVLALEFMNGQRRVGAMLIGRPASRELDPDKVLELTRMYFVDDTPANTESAALAMMRKHIRTWYPGIRLLLAYSDPSRHTGTIYEVDGWAPFGRTRHSTGYGWKNRPDRANQPVSPKLRWVRTP